MGMKVGAILDPFSFECFRHECDLVPVYRDNLSPNVDLLLVESTWQRGVQMPWLERLVDNCRKKSIPTLFWNKEDPVHFERFLGQAKLFDYVLTSDANMVPEYEKHGCKATPMMFAAQPAIHKPLNLQRVELAMFAGSYYGEEYPERQKEMELIFQTVGADRLHIFDRNYHKGRMQFPEQWHQCVAGGLTYPQTCQAYAQYRVVLNLNSVTTSPTMCARRIFEAMACGTPVVSNKTPATEAMFGDVICYNDDVDKLFSDQTFWKQRSEAGRQLVLEKHTYKHRWEQIKGIL